MSNMQDLMSLNQSPSDAHPETMDFLSTAWCNFAVQTLQLDHGGGDDHLHHHLVQDKALALLDKHLIIKNMDTNSKSLTTTTTTSFMLDKGSTMDDGGMNKPLPPWKSNDVKSWIWMQQAMHPELNYNSYFKKRWMSWKAAPLKNVKSITKWFKETKQRRKEEERLQKAEVHAAISVAGVAAALAAMAAEKESSGGPNEAAVASAAALVASQCAKVAEAMGAKREQLSSVIASAVTATAATDHIFTLAAAAKTSLKGASTLKARSGCKNKINGITPVLPHDPASHETDFDSESYRSTLAKGFELGVETPDGDYLRRSVSVILSNEGKVVLQIRKLGLLKKKKESIIMDLHAELYKESEGEESNETCYLLALTTSKGIFKLDMGDDYQLYKTWAMSINHMLLISSSISKYQHFYEK